MTYSRTGRINGLPDPAPLDFDIHESGGAGSGRPRVCLVTTEFHGLFKNGGIGTANTGLALTLAQAGFDVTVAFASSDALGPRALEGDLAELKADYSKLGVTLDFVPASELITKPFEDPRSASYCVYLYLKQHDFDVVYFNDCGGHGYYSLLAKHAGVFPNAPRMYVVAHGPLDWVLELNSLPYRDRLAIAVSFLERRSAALAETVISPSRYLADWMASHGWELPADVRVLPNIVILPRSLPSVTPSAKPEPTTEIVFFGRLEVRKGLELFCDAVDLIDPGKLRNVRITVMGKFSHIAGLHSGMYVFERARRWPAPLRVLSTYGQEEALAYLTKSNALAVIPSLAENSPCVVAECLELGLPFIATDSGGTAELVVPEDRAACLVAPDPAKIAAKLERAIECGHRPARPANSGPDLIAKWLRLTETGRLDSPEDRVSHSSAAPAAATPNEPAGLPLVSVCLAPSSRMSGLPALLQSLLQQKYLHLELILLDHSTRADRHRWPWANFESARDRIALRVLPRASGDRSAARNEAAAQAQGQYLLFFDEDQVTLLPHCIEVMVAAALRTGADIITGVPWYDGDNLPGPQREGSWRYFPIGACVELGAFENCFGSGAFLVKRSSFEQVGGFQTPAQTGVEDWLFLAASVLSGLHIEVVPESLFRCANAPSAALSSSAVDHHRRILSAYGGQPVQIFKHILEALLNIDQANEARLHKVLSAVGKDAREIALRVSTSFEPNHPDALRGFIQFCVERHGVEEAFDFALHNRRSLLADLVGSAELVAENLALEAVHRGLDFSHRVELIDEIKDRVQSVSPLPAKEAVQPHDRIAQSIRAGVTIMQAAAACPPGATSVHARLAVEAPDPPSVSVALVVCSPGARLRIEGENLVSDQAFWWSGWCSAGSPEATSELSVQVAEPADALLDLYFMCKTGEASSPEGKVIWTSIAAVVSVRDTISRSAIQLEEVARPIPRQILDRGVLLTPHADFPFPVFVPGDSTLVHPLPDRVVLVRLPQALPSGAKGIRSVVSLERAQAHPVQFGVWIRPPSQPAAKETDFTDADAFSGWFTVPEPFRRRRFTANLHERASEPMDVYLATRVVEYPDVYFCHAVWHELLILE